MEWKPLTAFGNTKLASTICYCLNFQQGLNRDEISRAKLDIEGETKSVIEFGIIDLSYDTNSEYLFVFRK